MHLLVPLQVARRTEPHGAPLESAMELRHVGVVLTHVGFEQFVLLEFKAAVFVGADVAARGIVALDVALAVGVRGESLGAALHSAGKRFLSTVNQLMTRQVIRAAERLTAALVSTRVRLHSGVFA